MATSEDERDIPFALPPSFITSDERYGPGAVRHSGRAPFFAHLITGGWSGRNSLRASSEHFLKCGLREHKTRPNYPPLLHHFKTPEGFTLGRVARPFPYCGRRASTF